MTLFEENTWYNPDFLALGEANSAKEWVKSKEWNTDMKSRKTLSIGKAYNYNQMVYPETEIGLVWRRFCERIEILLGWLPNNMLGNWYPDGKSKMGWHSDDVSILEENTGVAILSLGYPRVIQFRPINNKEEITGLTLEHGSLFYMTSELQKHYQHCIPEMENATDRISLTFRKLV